MRKLAAWCHDRRRTVIGLWVAAFVVLAALWAAAAGEFVNNFNLPGTESQRTYDLLKDKFPQQSGDTANVVFAVKDGKVLDASARRSRQVTRRDREVARGARGRRPVRRGRARLRGRQDHLRPDPVQEGAGDVDAEARQDDGRGHARARRQGRRPGRARRRHHPLVDRRDGRRRRDLRHPRRRARAVPDARRRRDGPAAAQRAVRDGREPLADGRASAPACSTSSTGRRSWRR